MRQARSRLDVPTKGRGFYPVTGEVARHLRDSGLQAGLAVLHLRHTSASLLIQENADPEVRRDLERFFTRLCPDGDLLFRHVCEGDDDMPAHVRSALTAVNLTIPFSDGVLDLRTWQGIYLWEHRRSGHSRQIALHFVGE
jgi:secondary thiamine-phosphate synthase enzyme